MEKYDILTNIPDKRELVKTTSLKFKKDLIDFFGDDYKNKVCLEIGTHKGYTTRVLSELFKKVISCENDIDLINFAKDLNKDKNNIQFLQKDVYTTSWNFKDIDVVFIDCNHEYSYVVKDINNAISLCETNKELLIIFDDYGLQNPWRGVKDAVNDFLEQNPKFNLVKFIGEDKGSDCNPRANLIAEEGAICSYTNKNLQRFWRIFENTLYSTGEVLSLGFEESEGLRIPDEYLEKQEFMIFRTAWGIGDWGIISAMPRLLKQKYPNCKVYLPSSKFIKKLFDVDTNIMELVFKNNPYVDGFKDDMDGEIFHDQYRIYNNKKTDIPLIEQMLKFWQFGEKEYQDSQPELYFSDDEKKLGDEIIKQFIGDKEFGCLLVSDRYGTQFGKYDEKTFNNETEKIIKFLKENDLPYFYYTFKPIKYTEFNFINQVLDMKNMDLRIQLYIKSKAKVNIGNQCGTNHLVSRYSNVYEVQRQFPLGHNFIKGETYL
ncbi:MAG: hypothetical protein CMI75_01985 [Candidatus Pelagibacter sp.]|nr:hypothetical protein [Candidatus Pelagibacter sp.]